MRATVWGCRGSLATPGPRTVRFGGNTSCVAVRLDDGSLLVLDAGTGIRELGLRVAGERPRIVHLLLTHLHLDHLEGLGFFLPLWDPETELHVWGPPSPVAALRDRIARYLSPPLFPLELADARAELRFHDVPREEWQIGSATITAQAVRHRGPTLAFRLEEGGRSLAYVPDHEPYLRHVADLPPEWLSGWGIAAGADVLLHDAQYFEDEYPSRIGWGHSSVEHAVRFARACEVGRLVLFHHDPLHADDDLLRLRARAVELWDGAPGTAPELAFEGMELVLDPVAASRASAR